MHSCHKKGEVVRERLREPPRIDLDLPATENIADLSLYLPWLQQSRISCAAEAGESVSAEHPTASGVLSQAWHLGDTDVLAKLGSEPELSHQCATDMPKSTVPGGSVATRTMAIPASEPQRSEMSLASKQGDSEQDEADVGFGQGSISSADQYLPSHYRASIASSLQLQPSRFSDSTTMAGELSPHRRQTRSESALLNSSSGSAAAGAATMTLDVIEDKGLPGFQLSVPGSSTTSIAHIQTRKQMMGWKAVQTKIDSTGRPVKSARAWKIRQEAVKNSHEFRNDDGDQATMHGNHRMFKVEWIIYTKDGTRYSWNMGRNEMAMHRVSDGVKVAEYFKAVPSDNVVSSKIGSIEYHGDASIDFDLVFATFVAIVAARGSSENITAGFEASSDPKRAILQRKQDEKQRRENSKRARPRPHFARDAQDAHSVLSDTTDEEEGGAEPPARPTAHPAKAEPRRKGFTILGRTFGGHTSQQTMPSKEDGLTAAQRIANDYHSTK